MVDLKKTKLIKPYIQKTVTLTRRNIRQYTRPEWHREFRERHITAIMNGIMRGDHPSENLTINQLTSRVRSTQNRILNGNHRTEAIRRIIKEHPTFSIEVTLTIYTNLTKEEEITIYEKINNTKRETGLDKLKAHLTGTVVMELINKKFPFRVLFRSLGRNDRNAITAGSVFGGYVYRNDQTISGGANGLLKRMDSLNKQDYDRLFKFATFFKRVCGEPSRDNLYSSYNVFSVLGKLYYTLVGTELTEAQYETKLRKIIARHTTQIALFNKGVHFQKDLYLFIINKLGSKKLFNVFNKKE